MTQVPADDELRDLYERKRYTVPEVADRFGWKPTKARKMLLAAGVQLRRPGTERRSPAAARVRRADVDVEHATRRYVDEGWSLRDVADELGHSKEFVRTMLHASGVAVRAHEREIDVGELEARYVAGASMEELGREYGVTGSAIRRRLIAAGVRLRPPGTGLRRRYPLLEDRDWLERRYVTEGASTWAIGRELGCRDEWVRQALLRHGIPIRSLSDAHKLRHQRRR